MTLLRNVDLKRFLSWCFYDFANTIFSAVVLTAFFPLYLTRLAGANWYLGAATTTAMVIAGLAIPFLGALSDATGRTKSYLIKTTLLCIAFLTLFFFSDSPAVLILLFIPACFFYHASLVFYNALLPVAAPPEKQGLASGIGTGLGYLGVVIALPLANWIDKAFSTSAVFLATAGLFLIFSLPLFFLVPERRVESPVPVSRNLLREEWRKLLATLRRLPGLPKLLLFLGGNFFVVDALNSAIFWLAVYTREVFHPGQDRLILLLTGVNISAFAGGILNGILTDRIGAMRTLILNAVLLAVTLGVLASVPSFFAFLIVIFTGGAFAISGIWTAGRKVLIELSPAQDLGQYFGLYGLTTKISVIGSLMFSVIADQAGFRPALWVLVAPASLGAALLIFSASLKR